MIRIASRTSVHTVDKAFQPDLGMVGKADQTVYLTLGLDVNERGQLAVTLQDLPRIYGSSRRSGSFVR